MELACDSSFGWACGWSSNVMAMPPGQLQLALPVTPATSVHFRQ